MESRVLEGMRKRMPAEWEDQEAVMVAFPHEDTDWGDIIEEAREQFTRLIYALSFYGERVLVITRSKASTEEWLRSWFENEIGDRRSLGRVTVIETPINDTWTRDYGPLSIVDTDTGKPYLCDFGFNGWGLKFEADLDNEVNHRLMETGVIDKDKYIDCRDFILEGGSLETDGKGTLLTTSECLLNPNRNPTYCREEIEGLLRERLGFTRILWLDHGHIPGDDTDSHIDTLCRLAPDDIILYTSSGEDNDPCHKELELMREQLASFRTPAGRPYHLVELPLPDTIRDEEGNRLAATYANYLVTPRCVYVPSYGQPRKDRLAVMTLQMVYTSRKVVPVNCRTLITQGGSLHCSTMQLYPGTVNIRNNSR